jgi:osmotically-inducible protein OsmY
MSDWNRQGRDDDRGQRDPERTRMPREFGGSRDAYGRDSEHRSFGGRGYAGGEDEPQQGYGGEDYPSGYGAQSYGSQSYGGQGSGGQSYGAQPSRSQGYGGGSPAPRNYTADAYGAGAGDGYGGPPQGGYGDRGPASQSRYGRGADGGQPASGQNSQGQGSRGQGGQGYAGAAGRDQGGFDAPNPPVQRVADGDYDHGFRSNMGLHRGRGPKNYARSDERVREDINDRLSDDSWIDASEIEVQVKDGEVTLSGQVERREDKRRAEDLAEQVSGVKHVQNNLRVQAGAGGSQPGESRTAQDSAAGASFGQSASGQSLSGQPSTTTTAAGSSATTSGRSQS